MTERYTPVVGHMVRHRDWDDVEALQVTAVGRFEFLTLTRDGLHEQSWKLAGDWIHVVQPEPLTEIWAAVQADGGTYRVARATSFSTAEIVHEQEFDYLPVAIIHIWSDTDGDHAEIARVTK
jgi:hypothetical protein